MNDPGEQRPLVGLPLAAAGLALWMGGTFAPSMVTQAPATWEAQYLSGVALALAGVVLGLVGAGRRFWRASTLHDRLITVALGALAALALSLVTDQMLISDLRVGPLVVEDAHMSVRPSDCDEGTGCFHVSFVGEDRSASFVLQPKPAAVWLSAAARCGEPGFARITWLPFSLEVLDFACAQ